MRKTKIVVSTGPALSSRELLLEAIKAGMDIARQNMSHQDHSWHSNVINRVREAASELGKPVEIDMDVQGPSVRTGDILSGGDEKGFLHLKKGDPLVLTVEKESFDGRIFVNYPELLDIVDIGSKILIDDAFVQLRVTEKSGNDIHCVSLNNSKLGSRRTIHIPGKSFNLPVLREKDWNDLEFGVRKDVDYVAISFVRSEKEINEVKAFLRDRGSSAKVIAKIETPEAIRNIDSIIKASDGIMIARGDMGVTMPLEHVPIHQYSIIKKCKAAGRFVITATEMLNSMKNNPLPTRAEVNDVFVAVASGSDAVMLSGETAEGYYPLESIEYMRRIVESAESSPHRLIVS